MPTLTSTVQPYHNTPTLFINGQPHTGLMFWHSRIDQAGEDIANFARAGVPLFTGGLGLTGCWLEDGGYDFSRIDATMAKILAANPSAMVLPRVGLEPPKWWHQRYPDETMLHHDIGNGDAFRFFVSFASQRWREDAAQALDAFIRHCETHFGGSIFGYHLCAGDCGEWSYAWKPVMSDFSDPQLAGFRAWLRTKYADDAALATVWADPAVTFDSAEISHDRTRPHQVWPRPWCLFDPARERQQIDYLIYHSAVVEDAILHFCQAAKATLRAVEREKVVGVFYLYHPGDIGSTAAFHNSGHHAHARVLASPDIDFICAPESYQERQPGRMYLSQLMPGSVRLHGKLYYNEDDTFTHLAKPTPWRYCCPDAETTRTCCAATCWAPCATAAPSGGWTTTAKAGTAIRSCWKRSPCNSS
ncbi:MAG: beta-galactosidase [Armatimonadota bacterium]